MPGGDTGVFQGGVVVGKKSVLNKFAREAPLTPSEKNICGPEPDLFYIKIKL